MEIEVFQGIKKGNPRVFKNLYQQHLKRSWFLCYQITQNVCTAAPLLISAWEHTMSYVIEAKSPPEEGFQKLLSMEILKLSAQELENNLDFSTITPPKVAEKYQSFVDQIQEIPTDHRSIYLMNIYGGLTVANIAEVLKMDSEDVIKMIKDTTKEISDKSRLNGNRDQWALQVQRSAEFRNPTGIGFEQIEIPPFLFSSLEHQIHVSTKQINTQIGKDTTTMTEITSFSPKDTVRGNRNRIRKTRKIILFSVIAVVLIVVCTILLFKVFRTNTSTTSITSYRVESITYGEVNTTISGSGTLSPKSRDTLTCASPVTITAVNYTVGDSVTAGDVIAAASDSDGNNTNFTAPYDCVLLELPIAVDDTLAANSEIAMVMGTYGFTMGMSVGEQNISTVQVGQEVTFTLSAVDGSYTGTVSEVSYNGSLNGNTTAYQITATVDYIEGVYPGMSADAEIVIESSGEGLLVPVDAIRTSGDDNYVLIAPSGAQDGTEYQEDEIDVSKLTKVTVETGMSDGSYIVIESDELSEGDLIVITKLTSTLDGSDGDSTGRGMGGFPGGGNFSGEMNFGEMGDFDPNNIPQGGFPTNRN